jgi:hypothetical protein
MIYHYISNVTRFSAGSTKKNMFQVKKAKTSYKDYPTDFAGSFQSHEKMIGIKNQSKIVPKKYV